MTPAAGHLLTVDLEHDLQQDREHERKHERKHGVGTLTLRVSFVLKARRSVLFGPSGAGKSTLLRILAGLIQPQRGSVRLGEQSILTTEAGTGGGAKRIEPGSYDVGLVTQQPALFPHLSVEENIAFGLKAAPVEQRSSLVAEHLERFALGSLRQRRPGALSGGERQRVALVRMLVRRPRLLLLDEPFSALDGSRRAETWAALDGYLDEHQTSALLVTHDVAEAWAWADDVLRITDGKIVGQGAPAAMLQTERARILQLFGQAGADSSHNPRLGLSSDEPNSATAKPLPAASP